MEDHSLDICPICGKILGDDVEEHHVIPISYGGDPNGKTIFIHSACHFATHKTAESIVAKTVKNKNWFPNEDLLKRAAPYVKAIIDAKRRAQEGEIDIYNKRRRMIVVQLSEYEWRRLHKVQKDAGYSNLMKYIEDLLRSKTNF